MLQLFVFVVMLTTFMIAWLVNRSYAPSHALVFDKHWARPTRSLMFLISTTVTVKLLLTWILIMLMTVCLWYMIRMLLLEVVVDATILQNIQSTYVDALVDIARQPAIYGLVLICILATLLIHLVLILTIYSPEATKQEDSVQTGALRPFIHLVHTMTALVFFVGFAFEPEFFQSSTLSE
jgi:hypothetical protein